MATRRTVSMCGFLAIALAAAATVAVASTGTTWIPMSDDQLDAIRVGGPPVWKCCERAAYTECGYGCNGGLIHCPAQVVSYGSCAATATCKDGAPNENCTAPSRNQQRTVNKCTTTGYQVACTSPSGTNRCDVTLTQSSITTNFIDCNVGDSLCASQPNPACQ